MFCLATLLIIQAILYIWKKYRQITGRVVMVCSNFYFSKGFCRSQAYSQIYIHVNNLLMRQIDVTNSDSTKVIFYFE